MYYAKIVETDFLDYYGNLVDIIEIYNVNVEIDETLEVTKNAEYVGEIKVEAESTGGEDHLKAIDEYLETGEWYMVHDENVWQELLEL